jgi:UDP-N-acetylglucosamine--N-acetylmuramyl-(pentapeptide) pyrophosphoryl-undecaprenol N-acetylglucosamine transferase
VFFKTFGDSLTKQFPVGAEKIISGKIEIFNGNLQMSHPEYVVDAARPEQMPLIETVYPLTAGVTNKMLSKKATKICVAYEGMDRFFPADRIIMTGNPVRQNVLSTELTKEEARQQFGLDPNKKTILLVGGSLGARTLNESIGKRLDLVKSGEIQFIWQTGKYYNEKINAELKEKLGEAGLPNLKVMAFIKDMGAAYKAADLVISRAGASSISEFCLIGKPVILVPSPNVAEDHQTKNAMALVNKQAALFVKDAEAADKLLALAIKTVEDDNKLEELSKNIKKLGLTDSADHIADEVLNIARK